MAIVFIVLGLVIAVFLLTVVFGAPYVPSLRKDLDKSFDDLFVKNSKENKVFIDLGSGDGKVLLKAREFGFQDIRGYEINPFLVLISKYRTRHFRDTIKIYNNNFFNIKTIPDNAVIYVFSESRDIEKIYNFCMKIARKSGVEVKMVSYAFKMSNIRPIKNSKTHYIYEIK